MASWLALILFGVLQGITEFLPVSSSGHLTFFQYFSREIGENLSLNIAVHVGTLLTVLIFYRQDIKEMIAGVRKQEREACGMLIMIVLASLPTALVGFFLKREAGWILTDPLVAAMGLLLTGSLLLASGRIQRNESFHSGFGIGAIQALLIGLIQGFSVLPGISRSGSTIVTGLALGMNPRNAARFSFLISIPAILGAAFLDILDWHSSVDWVSLLVGGLVSFLTGLFGISWMVSVTMAGRLKFFSAYVFILAISFLVCYLNGWGQGIF